MSDLIGKVALVTGASRGIGKAIAKELAQNGASVIINYSKDDEGANSTLKEIRELGGYAKVIKKDISIKDQCEELIKEIIETFGKIDILINNAAKSEVGLFMDVDDKSFEKLINTNETLKKALDDLDSMEKKDGGIRLELSDSLR